MIDSRARYVRAGVMLAALTSETVFHTLEGMDAKRANGMMTSGFLRSFEVGGA
jgi:hypothetical protein